MFKKKVFFSAFAALLLGGTLQQCLAQQTPAPLQMQEPEEAAALLGRWDLTVQENGKEAPSWLEVSLSGYSTLVGQFVGTAGSARPVSQIHLSEGTFQFAIPPQWETATNDLVLAGRLSADGLEGEITYSDGSKHAFTGVKAPRLRRTAAPKWGKRIDLFNGKDLSGWTAAGDNQWEVRDGILTSPRSGANLISDKQFTDFKLHVEFRYQKGSNSGVYLRGRHEIQIEDADPDQAPASILFGGLYGFIAPNQIAALGPDQWQTFDIELVGRMLTVVANGKTVICEQEIPGITGGALDSHEGLPGPIYIQGDHGPIEFRKIQITPAEN